MQPTERDEKRFWSKVALPNEQGCMLWLRPVNRDGYGGFYLAGQTRRAHRVSYVIAYGPIPKGMEIDHVKARGCTNRHCVAPLHLEAVTGVENTRRSNAGSNNRSKTHCPKGHLYNVATYADGRRRCHACQNKRDREAYRKSVAGICQIVPITSEESTR